MAILPKVCSPEFGKKSCKKKKNNLHLNIILHLYGAPDLRGRLLPILACGPIFTKFGQVRKNKVAP